MIRPSAPAATAARGTGHRVAADERESHVRRGPDDGAFGTAGVGHDGALPDVRGQLVKQGNVGEDRSRQNDEVGARCLPQIAAAIDRGDLDAPESLQRGLPD